MPSNSANTADLPPPYSEVQEEAARRRARGTTFEDILPLSLSPPSNARRSRSTNDRSNSYRHPEPLISQAHNSTAFDVILSPLPQRRSRPRSRTAGPSTEPPPYTLPPPLKYLTGPTGSLPIYCAFMISNDRAHRGTRRTTLSASDPTHPSFTAHQRGDQVTNVHAGLTTDTTCVGSVKETAGVVIHLQHFGGKKFVLNEASGSGSAIRCSILLPRQDTEGIRTWRWKITNRWDRARMKLIEEQEDGKEKVMAVWETKGWGWGGCLNLCLPGLRSEKLEEIIVVFLAMITLEKRKE